MDKNITHFLQQQTCATICIIDDDRKPYCFNCFYAFNKENGLLYFKSSADSYHAGLLKTTSFISGTILPDKLDILKVRGVQFEGLVLNEQDPLTKNVSLAYHQNYPLALAIKGTTWTIQINRIKLIDGKKGIRRKITWQRND